MCNKDYFFNFKEYEYIGKWFCERVFNTTIKEFWRYFIDSLTGKNVVCICLRLHNC